MFLCRAGRLHAAALDQAFKSPGSFLVRVKANRLKHDTVTLTRGHTAPCCRSLCGRSTLAHLGKQLADPRPVQNRRQPSLSLSGFVITDWRHCDRVAAAATVNLFRSGHVNITSPPLEQEKRHYSSRRGGAGGLVLFTGNAGASGRRWLTRSMHTRASSTAAAAKKSEEEQQTTGSDKGVTSHLNHPLQVFVYPQWPLLTRAHRSECGASVIN